MTKYLGANLLIKTWKICEESYKMLWKDTETDQRVEGSSDLILQVKILPTLSYNNTILPMSFVVVHDKIIKAS